MVWSKSLIPGIASTNICHKLHTNIRTNNTFIGHPVIDIYAIVELESALDKMCIGCGTSLHQTMHVIRLLMKFIDFHLCMRSARMLLKRCDTQNVKFPKQTKSIHSKFTSQWFQAYECTLVHLYTHKLKDCKHSGHWPMAWHCENMKEQIQKIDVNPTTLNQHELLHNSITILPMMHFVARKLICHRLDYWIGH